jgi:copper(I)-binding protein
MKRILLLLMLCATTSLAHAQVSVKDAWIRATVPQQKATGAFMRLTAARDVRLVEVRTALAGSTELHAMTMTNNVMRMRAVDAIDLPAGKTVELAPDGYHVMLLDLKGQVKEGQGVPLTLVLEGKDGKRESVQVTAAVRPLTAHSGAHAGH